MGCAFNFFFMYTQTVALQPIMTRVLVVVGSSARMSESIDRAWKFPMKNNFLSSPQSRNKIKKKRVGTHSLQTRGPIAAQLYYSIESISVGQERKLLLLHTAVLMSIHVILPFLIGMTYYICTTHIYDVVHDTAQDTRWEQKTKSGNNAPTSCTTWLP